MKKFILLLVSLVVMLFSVTSLAYTPPHAPANGGYVLDQAGKLSDSQIQSLNEKIERISQATKNEFGILLLQNMDGNNIEDVANSTYKAWGVGKKGLDNGCLIVVALKEHKSRIETGKGVEGEITDLQANDVLKRNLNPHLKAGDFYGAFDDTLNALSSLMESRINQQAEPKPTPVVPVAPVMESSHDSGGVLAFILLGGAALVAIIWLAVWLLGLRAEARRREQEELEELEEQRRKRAEAEREYARMRKAELEREDRERQLKMPTPLKDIAPHGSFSFRALHSTYVPPSHKSNPKPVMRPTIYATSAATAAETAKKEKEAHQARRAQEERDEEDDRRRREEDDSSSSSSSSSFDWSSGSSGGSDDSGGGFGGGDSGGGGSSSDW